MKLLKSLEYDLKSLNFQKYVKFSKAAILPGCDARLKEVYDEKPICVLTKVSIPYISIQI